MFRRGFMCVRLLGSRHSANAVDGGRGV